MLALTFLFIKLRSVIKSIFFDKNVFLLNVASFELLTLPTSFLQIIGPFQLIFVVVFKLDVLSDSNGEITVVVKSLLGESFRFSSSLKTVTIQWGLTWRILLVMKQPISEFIKFRPCSPLHCFFFILFSWLNAVVFYSSLLKVIDLNFSQKTVDIILLTYRPTSPSALIRPENHW